MKNFFSLYNNQSNKCALIDVDKEDIDYKNLGLISGFLSERGKILPSRITNVCQKKQRRLARAVKRARQLALLPYVKN